MIERATLLRLAGKRLIDSQALLAARRYEGAYYICGYAVELALKACICKTLGWAGFPGTRKEFELLSSFRTHDLETLLKLSGRERKVRSRHLNDWSIVSSWSPEIRYGPPQPIHKAQAEDMLDAARRIAGVLET